MRGREEAGGRSERDGVRAHVRGQGRRLDARRRRPLEVRAPSICTPTFPNSIITTAVRA